MKRTITIALMLALTVPASAQALTISAKTTNGRTCTMQVITEPNRYGLEVGACLAKRASSTAYLFENGNQLVANTPARDGRVPYSNVATSSNAGDRVRVDFAIFLKQQRYRRHPVKWRRKAGGEACKRIGGKGRTPGRGTRLECRVIVSTG